MELFYYKVTASDFNVRELHHKCFPIIFANFFRTATLKIICKQLLLKEQLVKPKMKVNTVITVLEKRLLHTCLPEKNYVVFLNVLFTE